MKSVRLYLLLTSLLTLLFISCGQSKDPLTQIHKDIQAKGIDTYSIILSDMQTEGNFIKSYFQSYRVITPDREFYYDSLRVPKKMYDAYKPYLGMTIE